MYTNPFVAQFMAKECIDDAIRRAEHARLVRTVEGESKPWRWQLPGFSAFKSMLTLISRPQFNHRAKV